jgi:hypothetical protein
MVMSPVFGQKLYRCGNSFSQTPCGADAVAVGKTKPASTSPVSTTQGAIVCAKAVQHKLDLPPGHTAAVEYSKRGPAETITYADQPIVTRTVNVTVVVRNAMGANVGQTNAMCNVSEDEQRVLKMSEGR